MHSVEPLVFTNITPDHFAALEKLSQQHNLSIVSNSGRTQRDGYDVEWNYEEESQKLTITIRNSPFWVPKEAIEHHFKQWIDDSKPLAEVQPPKIELEPAQS